MEDSVSYEQEFEELKCIGRGNFGAAYVVKMRSAPEGQEMFFIAKKIILGHLSEKDKKGAYLEAEVLKRLDHPNIVSYRHSFVENGVLIIIMEYCEQRDLGYHIRKRREKGEHFTETEIMNWFVQICLALENLHSKKVLHRDLKPQNIFLTKQNTVKLGDFGISKVLESTIAVANTVNGTPYYMSPEVCQNKPYSYKSDIWALGCILFELCELQYAFTSSNLLSLAVEIVQKEHPPISSRYSKDVQDLVNLLMVKDPKTRPRVIDIFRRPIVKKHMQLFVESNGTINLQNEQLPANNQIKAAKKMNELKHKDKDQLSAADQLKLQKEKKYKEEFEKMSHAALLSSQNTLKAKQQEFDQFHKRPDGGTLKEQPEPMFQGEAVQNQSKTAYGFHEKSEEPSNPYEVYQGGVQNNYMQSDKKGYLEKPKYISLDMEQSLKGSSDFKKLSTDVDTMASNDFQANDRSRTSEAFQIKNVTGGSDDFDANDRTGGSRANQPAMTGASEDFEANDRTGGSEAFQIRQATGASEFQVNDRTGGSEDFMANDRTCGSEQFKVSNATGGSEFAVNDRDTVRSNALKVPGTKSIGQASISIGTTAMPSMQSNDFHLSMSQQQMTAHDETPITASGSYNFAHLENKEWEPEQRKETESDEEYSDEFEEEAKPVDPNLNQVVFQYEKFLNPTSPTTFGETNTLDEREFQMTYPAGPMSAQAMMEQKEEVRKQVGSNLFDQLIEMIQEEIQMNTSQDERYEVYSEVCQGKQELMDLCFKLEEILIWEGTFTYE